MLGDETSKFLFSARQFVDFKFNESAIIQGVQENNPFAQRLFKEVFDSHITPKKNPTKNKIKMTNIPQKIMTMSKTKNWRRWKIQILKEVKKNSGNDGSNAMSCFENWHCTFQHQILVMVILPKGSHSHFLHWSLYPTKYCKIKQILHIS